MSDVWSRALRQAREDTGFRRAELPRRVDSVRAALSAERQAAFDAELAALSDGVAFEVFLDHWWTQALVDTAGDRTAKEEALDFADLAVSLRISLSGGPTASAADAEVLVAVSGTADAR
ncbi:hypothetical protein RKE29_08135 [Streptomyces sp. B1866]|uniref:hypothetical protein n=1 Tax=Streptomyces sp. B1866 TaxID=3075431 RepID=UPI00288F88D8|nr:hypothetical protein [Streptomyces sp. B1866]MDT3396610.1 hypothetical protein [Streptomyces sp. B1866]